MSSSNLQHVAVKHLAEEVGLDRSVMRKFILKLGIKPHKARLIDSRGAKALVITTEEADYVRRVRGEEYATQEAGKIGKASPGSSSIGVFYIIQVVPDLDPRRLKFGFTGDLPHRLAEHRTAAPTAVVLKTWPSKVIWEQPAIDCLSGVCRLILGEVYEADNLAAILWRADQFFGLLPAPDDRPVLASCSPCNT